MGGKSAWMSHLVIPVKLGWNTTALCSCLTDAMKKSLRQQLGQKAAESEHDRISKLQLWGVRALNSGVTVPHARHGHLQLYDRNQKFKVDTPWEEFVTKLPPGKRITAKGQTAFTLYLAYDFGVSTSRDMWKKPQWKGFHSSKRSKF